CATAGYSSRESFYGLDSW
nr:immunoglobulin heavy chain junction region [Macaca mulatta]MOX59532.1 immunoglobulin heavy chain junction region [Macaca mulatta]MOX60352.1 immunoglobulin heavy chain junction region [Macaca mulatta]MOX61083.1 immunoglobulin heavy chain junction region [Macaca mulatta]MOX61875.1 immunoglobulin heavy chain junction region [Macaca mulatta]